MPGFNKGATQGSLVRTPFGKNVWKRSPLDVRSRSGSVAASSVVAVTIDGVATKVLQPGTVLAIITSGPDTGKLGPFIDDTAPTGATNEVQHVEVDATGGDFTLTLESETTATIAANAAGSAVKSALEALSNVNVGDVSVSRTGSANDYTYVVTFVAGAYAAQDAPALVADSASLTGGTHTATVTTATAGVAAGASATAATDGRGDPQNIVGVNDTFLPWQLNHRDVEVSVAYDAIAYADQLIVVTNKTTGATSTPTATCKAALKAGTTAAPELQVRAVAGGLPSVTA